MSNLNPCKIPNHYRRFVSPAPAIVNRSHHDNSLSCSIVNIASPFHPEQYFSKKKWAKHLFLGESKGLLAFLDHDAIAFDASPELREKLLTYFCAFSLVA